MGGVKTSNGPSAFVVDHKDNIEKLKVSVRNMVHVDEDFRGSAFERMRNSPFGILLGKDMPLDYVKLALGDLGKNLGEFSGLTC